MRASEEYIVCKNISRTVNGSTLSNLNINLGGNLVLFVLSISILNQCKVSSGPLLISGQNENLVE